MNQEADEKLRKILKELRAAHAESEKFYGKQLNPGELVKPMDLFDMALAFDTERRIWVDYELTQSEVYPDFFRVGEVDALQKEKVRLDHSIQAWKNRQFPSKFKDEGGVS